MKKKEGVIMINLGVIGCGQWGPNHIRNFTNLANCRVLACADLNDKRLKSMKVLFRTIHPTKDYLEIIRHPKIDAVVVATPSSTHYRIVKECLTAGKDVLCEKPLCLKKSEAKELIDLAGSLKKILMVGHVFLFNAGIRKLNELIRSGECGRIYYLHAKRTNLGPFRTDVNAVWDLASHDISICNYLLNAMPVDVSARGGKYLQAGIEDVAFVCLKYPMGILANIHVSWLDPKKVRQLTVVGDKQMIHWDDLDNVGPIKCYDRKVEPHYYYETFGEFYLLAKEGNITIPKLNLHEPLKAQAVHFLECVQSRKEPTSDGKTGLDVIRVIDAIQKSLAHEGTPVPIK
ncbi:MAG: Gfo/Idh/MocA family oxidoreductase [Candidatus Omnitrophica bacterium]|nr:Gfo/Idh/MocA family oxidoreductase [Candidatus Omnitrophota bacterium]